MSSHVRFGWCCLFTALLGAAVSQQARAQATVSQYSQSEIDDGAKLYAGQCESCHGPNGDSIGTVDLASNRFRRAKSDQDLMNLITTGIPESGMPAHSFRQAELTGLVAYLRNMRNSRGDRAAQGDPGRGKDIFDGKGGCASCHRVKGKGSRKGPDLTAIGTVRPADLIRQSLVDPARALIPINRPVRAVMKDGKVVSGRRLNEDTFTVQLADEQGRLVSLVKADLREFAVLTESRMPSYRDKLTGAELADLLSYLLSLKGS
jgi:putative heme-binding domain-containing protein